MIPGIECRPVLDGGALVGRRPAGGIAEATNPKANLPGPPLPVHEEHGETQHGTVLRIPNSDRDREAYSEPKKCR